MRGHHHLHLCANRLSADGFELTWAVNVLAPFLLTSLLWRHVTSRIVTTASISAASHLDMANLQQEKGYRCDTTHKHACIHS